MASPDGPLGLTYGALASGIYSAFFINPGEPPMNEELLTDLGAPIMTDSGLPILTTG